MAAASARDVDRFVRKAKRRTIFAYWLDALLVAGLIAGYAGVRRALTLPRNAAVLVTDVRKAAEIKPEHIGWAPLEVSPRNVTRGQKIEGLVALHDLEPGVPLRWREVARQRPRARAGELELALKLSTGKTPPRAGETVLLGVVASETGQALTATARVLIIDASAEPADVTVALADADAVRVAGIPNPQFTLLQRPPEEKR